MAASLYIVVEGEDPGFDIFVNGRALARHEDALERLAEQLRVRPLLEFFSADENSMALLQDHTAESSEWGTMLPRPQWFFPQEGLQSVRILIQFLQEHPAALGSETGQVIQELHEFERVLQKTEQYGQRWHLAVSFL